MILLQFSGSQDLQAFGRVCDVINDLDEYQSGGSHEFRLAATRDGRIVIADVEEIAKLEQKGCVQK